ncbi:hypothetical protein C9J01_18800 [Photobacterium rosenbergii]|uniref:PD-(D/E)XK nuclease superfamily protein n=1 Tax=Photobacterium rosenbergii TaxID=294936 RepID=A0A2T3N9P7_9GAMM|nr:hypothetical protein [Photobacterium rosenbergii]PSW10262.1 hypothetical protein C9J01_18800 [Photobacterium rosenbergii]
MNKHLNIFRTYAKDNRRYQLENDLTRALAICMQEDTLFFHEVLKSILGNTGFFNQLFEDPDRETTTEIEIQKKTTAMPDFDRVFAVSLSESPMVDFWHQTHDAQYDPICDLVITIDNILIIIEAKRDNINCTAQLYNQIHNTCHSQGKTIESCKELITPYDLNWKKLMAIAVKVASFEKMSGNTNRFLTDFIQLVKDHNFTWLPETPIGSLHNQSTKAIFRRVESAILHASNQVESLSKLSYKDRLGTTFGRPWADELLFDVDKETGDLIVDIYPGNTKGQGYHLFKKDHEFNRQLVINNQPYPVNLNYHIKFTGQSYISGLWLEESDFSKKLYTSQNFHKHTGRTKRDQWPAIENLLTEHLNLDWKGKCNWEGKLINSNRTQLNMSFGYEAWIQIPFKQLAEIDTTKDDISPLANFIESIYQAFETELVALG